MVQNRKQNKILELREDIFQISNTFLSKYQRKKADRISSMLVKNEKSRNSALDELERLIPTRPKRPLYYLKYWDIQRLPFQTRNCMRYIGDYVDILIKMKAYEITRNPANQSKSLGINLKYLKGHMDDKLLSIMQQFNKIYVDAKHVFDVGYRDHLFTAKEVVYSIFIGIRIGEILKKNSKFVTAFAKDKFLTLEDIDLFLSKNT